MLRLGRVEVRPVDRCKEAAVVCATCEAGSQSLVLNAHTLNVGLVRNRRDIGGCARQEFPETHGEGSHSLLARTALFRNQFEAALGNDVSLDGWRTVIRTDEAGALVLDGRNRSEIPIHESGQSFRIAHLVIVLRLYARGVTSRVMKKARPSGRIGLAAGA